MIKSKAMFAVHRSHYYGHETGALSLGVWPLAFSDKVLIGPPESYEDLDGFWALWEAVGTPEDFGTCAFGGGDLDGPAPDDTGWGGIWVYEVDWDPECDNIDHPETWVHLHGGTFRRPTTDELSSVGGGHKQDWQVVL